MTTQDKKKSCTPRKKELEKAEKRCSFEDGGYRGEEQIKSSWEGADEKEENRSRARMR